MISNRHSKVIYLFCCAILVIFLSSGCASLPVGYNSWPEYSAETRKLERKIIRYLTLVEMDQSIFMETMVVYPGLLTPNEIREEGPSAVYTECFRIDGEDVVVQYIDGADAYRVFSKYNGKIDKEDSFVLQYGDIETGWRVVDNGVDGVFDGWSGDLAEKIKGREPITMPAKEYVEFLAAIVRDFDARHKEQLERSDEALEETKQGILERAKKPALQGSMSGTYYVVPSESSNISL